MDTEVTTAGANHAMNYRQFRKTSGKAVRKGKGKGKGKGKEGKGTSMTLRKKEKGHP